jgi:hypothetical protein
VKRVRSRASSGGWPLIDPPRPSDPTALPDATGSSPATGSAEAAGIIGPRPEPQLPSRSSLLDASRIPAELRSPSDSPLGSPPSGESRRDTQPGSTAGAAEPASPNPAKPAAAPEAPGLREQLFATKDAARGLVSAHVDLAKAEVGDVLDEVKGIAILAGLAFGVLLLAGLLLPIGLALFVGETLFGSLGWGVLLGSLLLMDIAFMSVLLMIAGGRGVAADFLLAVVIGVIVGVVLGLDLTNRGWTLLGDQVAGNLAAGDRPLAVAAAVLAAVGALLGLLSGIRAGFGAAILGAIAGAIAGALLGTLTAVALGPRVGAAIGVTVALILWPAFMGLRVSRQGVDGEKIKARFWPEATIETTKETIEWVRQRMPLGRGS